MARSPELEQLGKSMAGYTVLDWDRIAERLKSRANPEALEDRFNITTLVRYFSMFHIHNIVEDVESQGILGLILDPEIPNRGNTSLRGEYAEFGNFQIVAPNRKYPVLGVDRLGLLDEKIVAFETVTCPWNSTKNSSGSSHRIKRKLSGKKYGLATKVLGKFLNRVILFPRDSISTNSPSFEDFERRGGVIVVAPYDSTEFKEGVKDTGSRYDLLRKE